MATNLFSSTGKSAEGASVTGGGGGGGSSTAGGVAGDFVRLEEGASAISDTGWTTGGHPGHTGFAKLFPANFDRVAAVKEETRFGASSNRVLSDPVLAELRDRVLVACGVDKASDGVLMAFVRAVCLAHAKNSGSVLQPGRAVFYVSNTQYDFLENVVRVLGEDYRRFFRCYADFTRGVLRGIMAKRSDPAFADDIRDIEWVAADRGLSRYPDLVHDSAEACYGLTGIERTALQVSKRAVLAEYSGGNLVDNPVLVRGDGDVGGFGMARRGGGGATVIGSPVSGGLGY